jgi:hypothetical protein
MKWTLVWCALCVFLSAVCVFAEDDHDSNEILIQLAPGVSINTINARYGTSTEDVLIKGTVYKVKVPDANNLDATVAAMKADPDIAMVDYNDFGEAPEAVRRTIAVIDTAPTFSKYHDQDAYNRIRAPQAQTLSTGIGAVVAVIDTGVDYRHRDLASHILRDSQGKVVGYDFVQNDRDPMDSTNGIDDDHDGAIDEGAGHGTHIAGIISLVAPGAKIMPLRVLNSDGVGAADAVARAIEYAVDYAEERKVPMVINLSLGFPTQSFVVLEAVQEALEHGVPVVASAGNDNARPHYPAAYSATISVAAIGSNGVKASFSNYGKNRIDLSAPGVGIYSTYLKGKYAWWDGTSMSAPFVSGEAALVMSMLQLQLQPTDDHPPVNISVYLKKGVDYIYEVNPAYRDGAQLGSGSIDLYSTLLQIQGADNLTVQKAIYTSATKDLTIWAKSSKTPTARLSVTGIGLMTYDPSRNLYVMTKALGSSRSSVTITSTGGGIITAYVGVH